MGNFFSAEWFLDAAASILPAGRGCRPATVEVQGSCFRALRTADGRVVLPPLVDFYEPIPRPAGPVVQAEYIARVALGDRPVTAGATPPSSIRVAPFIDWSCHRSWQDFVDACMARNSRAFRRSPRRLRRLERDIGEVRFALADPDHELLERTLMWKSRQLRRLGGLDHFCSLRNRQFLHHLLHAGHLRLATLSAGSHVLATLVHHQASDRICCWISAYDQRFSRHSPGILLFEHLMRHSFEQRHARFDFLIGDESYKYYYATHELLVHALGRPRPAQAAIQHLRQRLDRAASPRLEPARQHIRRAAIASLEQRIRRNGFADVAADPLLPHYRAVVERDQGAWPRARIRQPTDCQLQVLISQAEADAGPIRTRLFQVQHGRRRVGNYIRRHTGAPPPEPVATPPARPDPLRLKSGERVRVRPVDAIQATLTDRRCQGLYYIPEVMDRHAGRVYVVDRPVRQFYDERGRQIRRSHHTVVLRDVLCDGAQLHDSRGCNRACPVFWHEAWLERVDDDGAQPAATPPPRRPQRAADGFAPGQRVRVRSLAEIRARPAPTGSGIAFVPAVMDAYAGQVHTVRTGLGVAYDERLGRVFKVGEAVVLADAHCPGVELTDGGRCDRRCALIWRPEWLQPVEEADATPADGAPDGRNATRSPGH